jgi:hypothetical protein
MPDRTEGNDHGRVIRDVLPVFSRPAPVRRLPAIGKDDRARLTASVTLPSIEHDVHRAVVLELPAQGQQQVQARAGHDVQVSDPRAVGFRNDRLVDVAGLLSPRLVRVHVRHAGTLARRRPAGQ